MLTVPEAFEKFRSRLVLTEAERAAAKTATPASLEFDLSELERP